jgi:hypothetical protein
MKTFWTYIATLFAGIIAGLLIFLKLKDPDSVINDNQRIGKVKQRGEGNTGSLVLQKEQETLTGMQ